MKSAVTHGPQSFICHLLLVLGWLAPLQPQSSRGKCDSCSHKCSKWIKTVQKNNNSNILEGCLPDACLEGRSVERWTAPVTPLLPIPGNHGAPLHWWLGPRAFWPEGQEGTRRKNLYKLELRVCLHDNVFCLVAVVCHWLPNAGQYQQFLALHCWSCNRNTNETDNEELINQERHFKLFALREISHISQCGFKAELTDGMSCKFICLFSLEELMRWRRTAREPTLLRSLLVSNFWRTNMTSRSGKEWATGKRK